MTSRKLLTIATASAALYAVVLVASASAALHRVQVTLVTGQTLTLTVDVPAGTPIQQVQIPGLPAPVQEIVDLGPVEVPTPAPTVPPVDVPEVDLPEVDVPKPDATPGNQQGGGNSGGGGGGGGQNSGGGNGNALLPGVNTGDESSVNRSDSNLRSAAGRARDRVNEAAERATNPDGSPTPANPTYSLATPGAARIGVPNFFIDKFRIPPFLLPIYQAAGIQYGVRWEILAAINEIETDYGRNLNVSSAGALGWMQFMPSTWRAYGVDANGDGVQDPYNPVDAIFAAARYLRAAGADQDIRKAVFAYNHANWYVDSVLLRAQVIGGLPSNLVGSLTGLTQGRFPIQAKSTYAGEIRTRGRRVREGNAAHGGRVDRPARDPPLLARARARGRGQRRPDRPHRPQQAARQLPDAAGRLRQHVHVRAPRQGQPPLPVAEAAGVRSERGRGAARAADARRPAVRRRVIHRAPGAPRPEAQARREGRARQPRGRADHREAASVRQPGAPERVGSRRRPAGVRAHRRDRGRGDRGRLLPARLRPRPQGHRAQAAAPRLARRGGHDPRPPRRRAKAAALRTCASRSGRPAAAPRGSTRSRSSTAGSCSSRPRSTAPPARTRSSAATPRTRRSARSC